MFRLKSGGRPRIAAPRILAITAFLLLNGCAGTPVTIKTLLDDPARFNGDTVQIQGDVEGSVGALGLGTYQMNDGTGTLRVVSKSGGAPREGAHVGVKGTFRSAFNIGLESAAVLIEKSRFTPTLPK